MLQVRFLGQFDVRSDGQRIVIPSRAGQSLFAYLILTAGTTHRREKLAGLFWPDISDEQARRYLRNELWRARKAIQYKPDSGEDYILADEYSLGFNPHSTYWLDAAALQTPASDLDSLISNLSLYQGELLPGMYEEWVLLERDRLRAFFDTRMQDLLQRLVQERRWNTVLEWSEKWIAFGDTPEGAYRALIVAYAASGSRGQAAATYERLRAALDKELGVAPSEETQELLGRIMQGEAIGQVDLYAEPMVSRHQSSPEEPPAPGEPPFKGLEYFEECDSALYFGREALTAQLTSGWTGADSIVILVGASGSGKSSFVRAGLVPALRRASVRQVVPNSNGKTSEMAGLRVLIITPTSHPLEALATALTLEQESVTAATTLMDDLARDPRSLYFYLRRMDQDGSQRATKDSKRPTPSGTGRSLLLVVDQFEELFTQCRDPFEREQFIDNLVYALSQFSSQRRLEDVHPASHMRDARFQLVLTLRADFYAHLAQYAELRALFANHHEYIGPMTTDEMRCAIEGPARQQPAADGMPWQFDNGLVDLILRDVGSEPGALPLLSHALLETWKRRSGHTMTLKGYHDAGGVRGAIAHTAETAYQELDPEQQQIAHDIFLRLTELGDATEDTRRRASFDELVPQGRAGLQVRAVLHKLADSRLVTLGESIAEVAHEALIREWPRLREWLSQDRDGLRLHRQLTEAAREWALLERDPDALYRGARLAQIREWVDTVPAQSAVEEPIQSNARKLNDLESVFLAASIEHAEREARERAAQQQRELEAAKRFAEAAEKLSEEKGERLKQQAVANKQLRRRTAYLAGALLLTLLMGGVAILLGVQADRNALAVGEREKARVSRELAATALNELTVDPERSILLALQALETAHTQEAEAALHRAVSASHLVFASQEQAGVLSGLDVNPTGTRIVTANWDKTARVWDAETGEQLLELNGHTGELEDIGYSPDGTRIVTAGKDRTAKIWDAVTGTELETLRGHTDTIIGAAFSPDGTQVATSSWDGTVRFWDVMSGRQTRVIYEYSAGIGPISYSRTGEYIAVGFVDGTTGLWRVDQEREQSEWEGTGGHTGPLLSLAFSPDGTRLVTGSEDHTARVWDVASGAQLYELKGHTGAVRGVSFSPDGERIATASVDGVIKLWSMEAGQELETLYGHAGAVNDVAFSPICAETPETPFESCGTHVASVGDDRTLRIWDVSPAGNREGTTFPGMDMAFSADGARLMTMAPDSFTARGGIWNLAGSIAQEVQAFAVTTDVMISASAIHPDKALFAIADYAGMVTMWDNLADTEKSRSVLVPVDHSHYASVLRGLAFSPDGERLVTGGDDRMVRVWDMVGNAPLLELAGHTDLVNQVAYSPDGARIISAAADRTARIWDAQNGKELLVLRGNMGSISSATVSPNGQKAATGTVDGAIEVWDAKTGRALVSMSGDGGLIKTLAFSPDGSRVASGRVDGSVTLWDAMTGQELLTISDQAREVTRVAFSPDGRYLAAARADGFVRLYLLDVQELVALAKSRLTRTWTVDECKKFLHLEQCPQ